MVKIGLVGTGHLGKIHLQQLKEIPEAEIVGIYDIDADTRRKVYEDFGVTAYDSLEELIDDSEALDIVTPTLTHFEIAKQALRKLKHIFIEKPVTSTVEEAERLKKMVREAGVKAQVGFVERFNPAFLAAKTLDLHPKFIEIHRLAQWNPRGTDVSVVLDLMIHDLDIVLHLVKFPIKDIRANGVAIITNTPDIATARIEFQNGTVANLTASRISLKNMRKTRIFQGDAYVSIDFLKRKTEVYRIQDSEETESVFAFPIEGTDKKLIIRQPEIPQVNAIRRELETFIEAIREDKETLVTLQDAYNSLKLANQILEKINLSLKM